jgi:hypothetical protein
MTYLVAQFWQAYKIHRPGIQTNPPAIPSGRSSGRPSSRPSSRSDSRPRNYISVGEYYDEQSLLDQKPEQGYTCLSQKLKLEHEDELLFQPAATGLDYLMLNLRSLRADLLLSV